LRGTDEGDTAVDRMRVVRPAGSGG
jgi:hypothetical protein